MFDVLSNIPASAEGEEGAQPASWCGADVVAAIGSAESSQKRRKRRRLAAEVRCSCAVMECLHPGMAGCRATTGMLMGAGERDATAMHSMKGTCWRLQEDDGNSKAEAGSARAAKWASPVLQRRAWSNAWLALLRMPLPPDILRKVR